MKQLLDSLCGLLGVTVMGSISGALTPMTHDQTRVQRQGQPLPGHAQGFALIDDIAGDVPSAVVLRRRPSETPLFIFARSRHAHGALRRRFSAEKVSG